VRKGLPNRVRWDCRRSNRIKTSNEFTLEKMTDGVVMYLNHLSSYLVEDKILDVEAVCKTSFGPLGDRLLLNVDFDGKGSKTYLP
jgi:hypothetical protein